MWNDPHISGGFLNDSLQEFHEDSSHLPHVFQREYRCYPVSFLDREELEKGNKILLPDSALGTLARMNVTWPMLFSLSNEALNRVTYGGVLEFTAEEGSCYIPYWVMKNLLLKEGDVITVQNITLPKGTYVKLQPVTSDFLDIYDHRAVLEHALSMFSALSAGDNIVIHHNCRTYEIEVVECRPAPAISIIETDIQVDFVAPKDYVEPQKMIPSPPDAQEHKENQNLKTQEASNTLRSSSRSANEFKLFHGTGRTLNDISDLATKQETTDNNKRCTDNSSSLSSEQCDTSKTLSQPNRIPGGVRTTCSLYTKLVESGRCSEFLSKLSARRKSTSNSPTSDGFALFSGEGNSCGL